MTGLADRQGDLYVLTTQAFFPKTSSPFTCNSVLTIYFTTWHRRLGHPSHYVHKTLSSIFPVIQYSFNKNLPCHFYPLAKHKRLSYTDSTSSTFHAFDLLHVDIWGPYLTPFVINH